MVLDAGSFRRAMTALTRRKGGDVSDGTVACGVSGGPDSMALLHLLSGWAADTGARIHAFTVDHGLRPESGEEAQNVSEWVKEWPRVTHKVLTWQGEKPDSRILEEARAARYGLLRYAMTALGIRHLFVAHHQDDQAETFLMRLAKGSGLDGLAAMDDIHPYEDIFILRPLLPFTKDEILAYCAEKNIPFIRDPTNANTAYMRPRLRQAAAALAEEGLSAKRLATTASRLSRARAALDHTAGDLFDRALLEQRADGFLFDFTLLNKAPDEIFLRVLMRAVSRICPDRRYAPRMERLENLFVRLIEEPEFKSATLGGCIFAKDALRATLWVGKEP
jgi:tRNA(Ile)-lysidine synthase